MRSRWRGPAAAVALLLLAGCSGPAASVGTSPGATTSAPASVSPSARPSSTGVVASTAPPSSTGVVAPTAPPFGDDPHAFANFDDDFSDPRVGWPVGPWGHGSIVQLTGRLRITVKDAALGWFREPSPASEPQLGFAADFELPRANPSDLGAGLACLSGSGDTSRAVYFTYQPVGFWLVEEVTAGGTKAAKSRVLGKGTTYQRFPGDHFRVAAGCQWLPGGTTRLTMILDHKTVWTRVVDEPGAYDDGWQPGVAVASATGRTAVVDVTHYVRYLVPRS